MRIVTLANHKGGVGKTTTSLCLAAGLSDKKYKVLLIDLDPQSNLSYSCGYEAKKYQGHTLYDVLHRTADINDCILNVFGAKDFDLLIGGLALIRAESDPKITDTSLNDVLLNLDKEYDFIVIDTPPSMGKLTLQAISITDDLIVPIEASVFALNGLGNLIGICEKMNPGINLDGLLLVGLNERTNIGKEFLEQYTTAAKEHGTKLYKACIHNSVQVPESQYNQKSLFDQAPKATVTKDYQAFVDEYVKGAKKNGIR